MLKVSCCRVAWATICGRSSLSTCTRGNCVTVGFITHVNVILSIWNECKNNHLQFNRHFLENITYIYLRTIAATCIGICVKLHILKSSTTQDNLEHYNADPLVLQYVKLRSIYEYSNCPNPFASEHAETHVRQSIHK
jgi:hypothetical protein